MLNRVNIVVSTQLFIVQEHDTLITFYHRMLPLIHVCDSCYYYLLFEPLEEDGGSADLKIGKFALLALNHYNFSTIGPIYTKYSFMEFLLNYLPFESKNLLIYTRSNKTHEK